MNRARSGADHDPARKKAILYFVVVGGLLTASSSLLVHLFAIGSPQAVPLLLYVPGAIVGALFVYPATRPVAPGRTLVGRLVWVGALVAVFVSGFVIYLGATMLGYDTASGGFVRGLGSGVGLTALMRLIYPYSWMRGQQER